MPTAGRLGTTVLFEYRLDRAGLFSRIVPDYAIVKLPSRSAGLVAELVRVLAFLKNGTVTSSATAETSPGSPALASLSGAATDELPSSGQRSMRHRDFRIPYRVVASRPPGRLRGSLALPTVPAGLICVGRTGRPLPESAGPRGRPPPFRCRLGRPVRSSGSSMGNRLRGRHPAARPCRPLRQAW
jgi:hypothetical protein